MNAVDDLALHDPGLQKLVRESLQILETQSAIYGDSLVYPTSLGISGSVLIDLICRYAPNIRIVTADTGKLPPETKELIEIIQDKYDVSIERLTPEDSEVTQMMAQYGESLYRDSVTLRKYCCEVRKIRPMKKALYDKAWITGRRRDQSSVRSGLSSVELNCLIGVAKINPLLDWTIKDVWSYVKAMKAPYNSLYDNHYASIGCAPCTRAITDGEDERAGRWWWEHEDIHAECGLHIDPEGGSN